VTDGVADAAELLVPLVSAIATGSSPADIATAVASYDHSKLDALFLESNVMAAMTGALMVIEGEPDAPPVTFARGDTPGDDEPFVHLPWTEAVEQFRKRGRVSEQDFARLVRDAVVQSEEQRRLLLEHVQESAYRHLAEVITNGGDYSDFATSVQDDAAALGISVKDDHYLRMVFRTNVAGAYSGGRDIASKDPAVLSERPIAQFLPINDMFTRPEHREYGERNGGGFYVIGSAEWELVRPPPQGSPWNCRCGWTTHTLAAARALGYTG
jgi:hypothetical protein